MHFFFLLIAGILAPDAPAREAETFRLHKFQQPIGIERTIRDRRECDQRRLLRASVAPSPTST